MNIDAMMNEFRLASRELFNHFFRISDPYTNTNNGWLLDERFSAVQAILFDKLVTEPASLAKTIYGLRQTEILVTLRNNASVPIMINREVDSGYWDFPIREVSTGVGMSFIRFFDWDQLDYRDNRYVRVQIERWASHPETVGKHALIESHSVRFVKASDTKLD